MQGDLLRSGQSGRAESFGTELGRADSIETLSGRGKRQEGKGAGDGVRLRERNKALEGMNPTSGSSMKEGWQIHGGLRRHEVEKT
jgi:hypothetical protein